MQDLSEGFIFRYVDDMLSLSELYDLNAWPPNGGTILSSGNLNSGAEHEEVGYQGQFRGSVLSVAPSCPILRILSTEV